MLKLLNGNDNPILNIDNFYIDELWSGLDELVFDIPVADPAYKGILEESVVEYGQPYLVKAIDGGGSTAKVKCQLNLDALKADMKIGYSNGSDTVAGTINGVLPSGWIVVDHAYFTARRTIESDGSTPLEIVQQCQDTYGVVIRYDVKHKQVHIWDPDSFEPVGAFASRDLNLKEVNYKGKSSDFATRLYAEGKDGFTFASINGGKTYVEDFTYSDKVICAFWKDERYTVAESLLEDAKKKLKELAVPTVSYSCNVLDLAKTNPELYGHQDFSLMQVVKLVDDIKGQSMDHQVVQYRRYPFYPEKNVITLSTVAPKIQSTVKNLQLQIEKPSSPFRQIMQAAIDSATNWITGVDGGYVVLHQNAEGKPYELLIMDTDSIETAKNVWRFNKNGWGHSSTGYNGKYTMAATVDGGFIADFIVAGTMLFDRLKGGTLTLGGKDNGNGSMKIYNASGKEIGSWDSFKGIVAIMGQIGGWTVGENEITSENGDCKVFLCNGTNDNKDFLVVRVKKSDGSYVYPFWVRADGHMGINLVDQSDSVPAITIGNADGAYMKMGADGFEVDFGSAFAKMYYAKGGFARMGIGQDGEEKAAMDSDGMIKTKYGIKSSAEPNTHINSAGAILETKDSSRRYKRLETTDLGDLNPVKLYNVPVKIYKYNEGYFPDDDPKKDDWFIGMIAEDMEEEYPCAVNYDAEGKPKNWDMKTIVAAELKLIQDLHAGLGLAKKKIKELEARLG